MNTDISALQQSVGAVMLAAAVLYTLLGGADFGGGILDALAQGPRRKEQRALIERAIGPIWEANHVWLIVVVVILFSCFPAAFAAISISLFIPLVLLLVGIVLRGASFTFRAYDYPDDAVQKRWGYLFSASSTIAPVMLGILVGTLASGRLRLHEGVPEGGFITSWLAPFPVAIGVFTAALFAFLAAVYLTVEAEGELKIDFRLRALVAQVVVVCLATITIALSASEAPVVFKGLTSEPWALPLLGATAIAASAAFAALWTHRFRLARLFAVSQLTLIVLGWGASQYPYLIVPDMTLATASGARETLVIVISSLAIGGICLAPALYLLFRVFKGERPFSVVDRRM